MMESNHLYRRIQNKNLFRTFSRTYSRQAPTRKPQSENKISNIYYQTNSTLSSAMQTNHISIIDRKKPYNPNCTSQRDQNPGSTLPIFKRSEGYSYSETPFSNTVNIASDQYQQEKIDRYSSNPYLNSLIDKKQERGSLLSTIKFENKKEGFKLKECIKKVVSYDADYDQADFSILEYNKRSQLKNKETQFVQESKIGVFRLNTVKGVRSQIPSNVGKRIAAHLFTKYNKKKQQQRKKTSISYSRDR